VSCVACSGGGSRSACEADPLSFACMCEESPESPLCTCASDPTLPGCDSDPPPCPEKVAQIGFELEVTASSPPDVLAGITHVPGSLVFDLGAGATDLSRFDLACLWEVDGELRIRNHPDLTSLHGLETLRYVKRGLSVEFNDALTSLAGLEGLHQIQDRIYLDRNPMLADISALASVVTGPTQQIYVFGDGALASLHGLEGVHGALAQGLHVENVPALTDIAALAGITSANEVYVSGTSLASLAGLDGVTTVGGNLYVAYNDQLASIAALGHVTTIAGDVTIGTTPVGSLDGLAGVTDIGGDLALLDLPKIATLAPLAGLVSVGSDLRVEILTSLTDASALGDVAVHAGYCSFSNDSMLPACQAKAILDQLVGTGSCPGGTVNTFNLGTCP
jgi:hypothetical protein